MALTPPEARLWWKEPLHRVEVAWITIAFLWGLVMFFVMVFWHLTGAQNLSNESYRITPAAFAAKSDAMIAAHTVRQENGYPVVRPPVGSDVYLVARLWEWTPILELKKDQPYRLHLSSMDWLHGFSLQPTNINVQVHPNYALVMTVRPNASGTYHIVCNEFCGIGHHQMLGKIYVVE